jgi:hypothetical protein
VGHGIAGLAEVAPLDQLTAAHGLQDLAAGRGESLRERVVVGRRHDGHPRKPMSFGPRRRPRR